MSSDHQPTLLLTFTIRNDRCLDSGLGLTRDIGKPTSGFESVSGAITEVRGARRLLGLESTEQTPNQAEEVGQGDGTPSSGNLSPAELNGPQFGLNV